MYNLDTSILRPEETGLTNSSLPVSKEELLGALRDATPAKVTRRVQADTTEDQVDCSVFAPPTAPPGSNLFIQVFAHLPEQAPEAADTATEFDEQAQRRGVRTLEVPIAPGDVLTVELAMRGLEVPEPVQRLIWRRRPEAVQFEALVPHEATPGTAVIGMLTMCRDGIPIGTLKFTIRIEASGRSSAKMLGDEAKRFTRAFVSYASKDRPAVLARVQVPRAAGIEYFQDIDMDPGERWEKKLYQQIDSCDLLLLFWSQAAKDSTWVRREVQYALALDGDAPDIRPVVIEGPPVPLPWDELAELHFDDRLLSLMAAAAR